MEIWLINHYAGGPAYGMGYRHFYLARYLQRQGINPTIISASFTHLYHAPVEMESGYLLANEEGINRIFIRTRNYSGNGLSRLFNTVDFARGVRRLVNCPKLSPPDVILGSSPHLSGALAAMYLARRWKIPFYFEVRDLLPQYLIDTNLLPRYHPLVLYWRRLEKKLVRSADRLISLLPHADEYFVPRGLSLEKFFHLPNGAEPLSREYESSSPVIIEELKNHKLKHDLSIIYAGSHGPANALDTVLKAANILQAKGEKRIHIYLIGSGPEKQRLQQKAASLQLANVHFVGKMSRAQLIKVLEHAGACYIGLKKARAFRYGVSPNKLLEYMLAGRPIIYAINSGNHPVANAGCGMELDPESPEKLAAAMITMAGEPESARHEMGRRGREYVLQHHRYETLAARLADLIRLDLPASRK